jgi:ABC-2 type transport system ATP-binding protein
MRQRLGIAQALLGAPDLLILDEPANGLDPAGIREIRRLVRALASERGLSVFVSSHLLSEVEQMCDRVAIIHRGRTLATGPVSELLSRSRSGYRIAARPLERAGETLQAVLPGAVERDGDEALIVSATADAIPGAVRALAAAGVEVFAVERRASTLEDVFLEVTGGETV